MPRRGLGPVEGWLVRTGDVVGFVKGCFHPLPRLVYTPRLLHGRKTWAPRPQAVAAMTRCFDFPVPVADPEAADLVSPLEAAENLMRGGCSTRACRAGRLLVSLLEAAVGEVGVTGGLAYSPRSAGDVDLVVYGWRAAKRAYEALRELRERGITEPHLAGGHGWSRSDEALHSRLAARRLLFGRLNGVEYNVRLVPCTRPAPCTRVRSLGRGRAAGVVCSAVGYTTPAHYRVCGGQGAVLVVTHRLRYMEIPVGSRVEVEGSLQEVCGMRVLTPDHGGWVSVTALPGDGGGVG